MDSFYDAKMSSNQIKYILSFIYHKFIYCNPTWKKQTNNKTNANEKTKQKQNKQN